MSWLQASSLEWRFPGSIFLAMVLGGALGLERELAGKPAGLRTHILVAGAAAFLVSISTMAVDTFQLTFTGQIVRTDPIRVVNTVVTAVSFLGAGTIIRHGSDPVEGLTTAASLLLAAGIGIAVAFAQFVLAIGVTVMTLIILHGLPYLERRIHRFSPITTNGKPPASLP